MITKAILDHYKLDQESLEKFFTSDKENTKRKELIDLISTRNIDGIKRNLHEHKIWWAIDKAYDCSFSQITHTLVESIMNKAPDDASVLSAVKDWGLTHMLIPAACTCGVGVSPCSCGCKDKKALNIPVFFNIFVPLVKAYVTIRWAKIFNDRNVYPLLKYEPSIPTPENRMRGEILTNRIQMMATQLTYNGVLRQAILQALLYSDSILFPMEHWYEKKKKDFNDKDEVVDKIEIEGIRYNLPHPSRRFFDNSHRISTLNNGTGCAFGGYWNYTRYEELKNRTGYWNLDKIQFGATNWIEYCPTYFNELYPCVGTFPTIKACDSNIRPVNNYYTTSTEQDQLCTECESFHELVPKDYGLGDYPYPVWFRFVTASDRDVIFAQAFTYNPMTVFTGDYDEGRERNSSLGLEILPFQDHLGNLLTQNILSVKQNLMNMVFVNTDLVDENDLAQVKNMGEKAYRAIPFVKYSKKESDYLNKDVSQAFHSVSFPRHNTQEIAATVGLVLNMLERSLQFAAQEIGQAATHEQSATETNIIANNTSNRLNFTASFIDDGINAWKRQLYDATMSNGSEEVFTQIAADDPITEETLKKLGFEAISKFESNGSKQMHVKGDKSALVLEGFASSREGENRINGAQVATAMVQLVQPYFSNPMLLEAIGAEQAIKIFNQLAKTVGLPSDFKLTAQPTTSPEEQAEDMKAQLAQLAQSVQESTLQQISAPLKQLGDAVGQINQMLQQTAEQVVQLKQENQAEQQAIQAAGQGTQQVAQENQQQTQAIQQIAEITAANQQAIQQFMAALQGVAAQAPPLAQPGQVNPPIPTLRPFTTIFVPSKVRLAESCCRPDTPV